jgi:transposase
MQHAQTLRAEVVAKAINGQMTQVALSQAYGVGRSTIGRWIREHRQIGDDTLALKDSAAKQKSPQAWTRAQRLSALLETHRLDGSARGAWCREHGVHTHHLQQWQRDLAQEPGNTAASMTERRALRQENRELKKELKRKDRALAETAALLVLKKKAAAIWGEVEDD